MSENTEPWDLQPDDKRAADTLRTFLIFCEDEHHEPIYFRSFEHSFPDLKVNAIPGVRSKKLNFNASISACVEKGLMAFEEDKYKILDGVTENIWCVYDRDMSTHDFAQIKAEEHIEFDTAIMLGESAGFKVAWSNDVFELWLLLHFEEVPSENWLHRDNVYDRLTDIFKNTLPKDAEMEELTTNATFNYKDNMKRRDRFINQVLPVLKPNLNVAIERAKKLEAAFNSKSKFHERNPCTMVHYLVMDLMGIEIKEN